MILQQACLDDSGKDTLAPAFVLAGYVGRANDMMDLADRWEAFLDKEPALKYVKGYEAFGLNDQFLGWTEKERDRRLLPFVSLIAKYCGKGIAFTINKKAFAMIKDLKDDYGNYFTDPYRFAYPLSLSSLLYLQEGLGGDAIDVVFDNNVVSARAARKAYREVFTTWPKELVQRLARANHILKMIRSSCLYRQQISLHIVSEHRWIQPNHAMIECGGLRYLRR